MRLARAVIVLVLVGCSGQASPRDAGPPREIDEPCTEDAQCVSGLCYGHVDPLGSFTEPVCHRGCIDPGDVGHYCLDDGHCCAGRCCLGCADREGACVVE